MNDDNDDEDYYGIVPDVPSDCMYCNSRGICKNDECRYYYDEECPGDCDYFYHK